MRAYHLIIKGKVQGVFYRETARRQAESYGIKGWIRNKPDTTVEALIAGPEKELQQFIAWCRKGPALAQVTEVSIQPLQDYPPYDSFSIIK